MSKIKLCDDCIFSKVVGMQGYKKGKSVIEELDFKPCRRYFELTLTNIQKMPHARLNVLKSKCF